MKSVLIDKAEHSLAEDAGAWVIRNSGTATVQACSEHESLSVCYTRDAKQGVWIFLKGRSYYLERPAVVRKKDSSTHPESDGDVLSPMPGRVFKVLRKTGDAVQAGDEVVVLEAMKMEHVLKAPKNGIIRSLNASVGDLIEMGKTLFVVG